MQDPARPFQPVPREDLPDPSHTPLDPRYARTVHTHEEDLYDRGISETGAGIVRSWFSFTAGFTVWGGSGVPPATLGAGGDFYYRKDGGGAGLTHLYFNNAGTWIGIA